MTTIDHLILLHIIKDMKPLWQEDSGELTYQIEASVEIKMQNVHSDYFYAIDGHKSDIVFSYIMAYYWYRDIYVQHLAAILKLNEILSISDDIKMA